MNRPASVAAIALALCGCAGGTASLARVDLHGACAADITAMTPHGLRPAPVVDGRQPKPPAMLSFATIGQCVATPSGPIAAALFKFDGVKPPARIDLGIAADASTALAAAVTLLDSRHQPIRRYGFDRFSRRGNAYTLEVFVNPGDDDATYLLVSPDAAWVGKEEAGIRAGTNTYGAYGPVYFTYRVGYEETVKRQLTDAGRLQIDIRPAGSAH